jgi:glycosyltransferase involved in cell wall biosynthesis
MTHPHLEPDANSLMPAGRHPKGSQTRHILFIFDAISSITGGAERSLQRITQSLPRDRYRASIVTFEDPPETTFFRQFGCPVHILPMQKSCGWESIRVARRLREIIRSEQVSIVQTFFATADLWGGMVAKLSGCPILISSRRDMGFLRTRKHRVAYRLLGPLYDRIHTVSEAVREFTIREDRVDRNKVFTIPNGVEARPIETLPDKGLLRLQYGLENASHVIVDVGTIRSVKGYDVLVRTAEIVCREYPQAVFVIAGRVQDQSYFKQLQNLVSSLGLSANFRFLGGLDDVFPLLKASDAFCHLSRTDGMSNALMEAMAAGLPCIISRVGGNPEVVEEGGSGFIVPAEDHEQPADRLLRILRDPALSRRMGERGRQIIQKSYTTDAMVQKLVELYDELLGYSATAARDYGYSVHVSSNEGRRG